VTGDPTFKDQLDECHRILAIMEKLLVTKGSEYSPTGLAFAGHKEAAESFLQGREPTQGDVARVLHIHFLKHYNAIRSYLQTGHVGTEGIEGRLVDAANYLVLMAVAISFDAGRKDSP